MKMLRTIAAVALLLGAAYACLNTVTTPRTCAVTVTVNADRSAAIMVEPMTAGKRLAALAGRFFAANEAVAYIPSIIETVRVTVTGGDMATVTATESAAGLDSVSFSLEVQVGTNRHFLVEGLTAANAVIYTGQATADLNGTSATIAVAMTPGTVSVPQLVTTAPADGATFVPYRPAVEATFSEAMDTRTFTPLSFTVVQTVSGLPVAGSIVASGATATFTPAADLAPNTDYTVTITNAVRSVYGIPPAANAAWIFTTAPTVPLVVAASPADGAVNVPLNTVVTAAFSEAMDPATVTAATFLVTGRTGTVVYNGPGRTATFQPASALATNTTYTATVTTGATSANGVPLAADHVWSFTTGTATDTTPPAFSGIATLTTVSLTSAQPAWDPATDDLTAQADIVYLVFVSTTSGVYGPDPAAVTAPGATSFVMTGLTPGVTYYFRVNARDAAGNRDTNTVELSSVSPGVYVDAVLGSDANIGSAASPFKTITRGLQVVSGMSTTTAVGIYAAPGLYDAPGNGESFPLQLTPLTTLYCRGAGHTTVIDATGSGKDTIYGNIGASVDGCAIVPEAGMTGVDDRVGGTGIPGRTRIENCVIDGPAANAVTLSTASSLLTSTVTGSGGTGVLIRTGRPAVAGNAVSLKQTGIEVLADTDPSIDGNRIEENVTGIVVTAAGGRPSVRNNTIANNDTGIRVTEGMPLIHKNEVKTNTIAGNRVGIEITGGMPTVSFNTVTSNEVGVLVSGGTPAIRANTLSCNSAVDLSVLIGSAVDAEKNEWDHAPPTMTGPVPPAVCGPGTDVCYTVDPAGIPVVSPFGPAVGGGCP